MAAQSESDAIRIATEQLKGTPGVCGDIPLTAVRDKDVLDTWFSSVRSQISDWRAQILIVHTMITPRGFIKATTAQML